MHRRLALAILTAIPIALTTAHAGAADLKALVAGAVEEPFHQLTAEFARETGNKVDAAFGPVGALQAKFKNGEKADVIILSVAAMDELDKAGLLVSGTRAELGKAVLAVAVRAGAAQPDIASPDAFKAALLAARSLAYTDPAAGGTSGIYLTGLLQRLGIADDIKKKAMLQPNGAGTDAAVANGTAELGIGFVSEILPDKRLKVVGPVPQPIGLTVTYAAAVATGSPQAEPARALITYLTRPAARDHFKEAGL